MAEPAGDGESLPDRELGSRPQGRDLVEDLDPGSDKGTRLSGFAAIQPRTRERTRSVLAVGLLIVVAVMILSAEFAVIFHKLAPSPLRDLSLIFTPIITLASAAFGFFFGQQS